MGFKQILQQASSNTIMDVLYYDQFNWYERLNCLSLFIKMASFLVDEHEYCLLETFHARCPSDEIIMITQAQYGRMKFGKCIAEGISNTYILF